MHIYDVKRWNICKICENAYFDLFILQFHYDIDTDNGAYVAAVMMNINSACIHHTLN